MVHKMQKTIALAVLLHVVMVGTVFAQDFGSLVTQATAANQRWVEQINQALGARDLATLQARAATAVATGEQVESLLRAALPLAPDDAARSRVQGVLTHVVDALRAGRLALEVTEFDAARGHVQAMRGEALEALTELAPFAVVVKPAPVAPVAAAPRVVAVAPAALPRAGGLPAGPLALGGLLLTLLGLTLRRHPAHWFGRPVTKSSGAHRATRSDAP
ncbi:MAG: hypothetical protein HYY04_01355 [Chloroflexi bacterium]|nr:hypothetical protein [Chloroflexota bacterium]